MKVFSRALTFALLVLFAEAAHASSADELCLLGPLSGQTDDCFDVNNDWRALRAAINSAKDDETIVFCPFTVTSIGAPAKPSQKASFACLHPHECIIERANVVIKSPNAQTTFWGFVFEGATLDSAVYIRTSQRLQQFCYCIFRYSDVPKSRGGAIRADRKTRVLVYSSSFGDNTANRGGAIYGRGIMTLKSNRFESNTALQGGAISFASYATLTLAENVFANNAAAGTGQNVYVEIQPARLDQHYTDLGGNQVTGDLGGCGGLLNRPGTTGNCIEFESTRTTSDAVPIPSMRPSNVPATSVPTAAVKTTNNPTAAPTIPTIQPSLRPTLKPSTAPSKNPTSKPSTSPSSAPSVTPVPSPQPSAAPSLIVYESPKDPKQEKLPLVSRTQPRGYFNYNMADNKFGPNAWHKVDPVNAEFARYAAAGLNVSVNECRSGVEQSPIDLSVVNEECLEFHQIRARGGDWGSLTRDGEITFQVLPTHLRIQIDSVNPKAPRADSPGGFAELYTDHVEITTPSLHTLNGRRFDAEYTIYHVQEEKNRILIMSVLVDASENDYNHQFQKILNAFSLVNDCGISQGRRLQLEDFDDVLSAFDERRFADPLRDLEDESSVKAMAFDERRLAETAMIDGKFNLYNIDMIPSIYWWAYQGSLPRPPCSTIANWRVVDTPMKISHLQLHQLKETLTDGPCDGSKRRGLSQNLARPLKSSGRVWRCTQDDYLSDCERFGRLCPSPDFP